jgi:hypothetical protein
VLDLRGNNVTVISIPESSPNLSELYLSGQNSSCWVHIQKELISDLNRVFVKEIRRIIE